MVNIRLKAKLLERGISGFKAARRVGVSDSKFSRIVRGWNNPDLETKKKLAKLLGCEVREIFEGQDNKG